MNKNKKYTVITGASSGIGYETAKAFARRGNNLIVVARSKEKLENLRSEILQKNSELDVIIKNVDLSISQNLYKLYSDLKSYEIQAWINNAGFGNYQEVASQNLRKVEKVLDLNVRAVVILSSLFVSDYKSVEGAKLINISSAGGYTIVPSAVTYCASKFFISAFTEGLAHELQKSNCKLQAKVLAPAATKTNFGNIANDINNYDYDKSFEKYHTSQQIAEFLIELYESNKLVGIIDREYFKFNLSGSILPYAGDSSHNQKL